VAVNPSRPYVRRQPKERENLRAPYLPPGWKPCSNCGLGVPAAKDLCPLCSSEDLG